DPQPLFYLPAVFSSPAAGTSEIYTLSLHDALPICLRPGLADARDEKLENRARMLGRIDVRGTQVGREQLVAAEHIQRQKAVLVRSEEHTSELQSRENLVCRLLLEKKKKKDKKNKRQ